MHRTIIDQILIRFVERWANTLEEKTHYDRFALSYQIAYITEIVAVTLFLIYTPLLLQSLISVDVFKIIYTKDAVSYIFAWLIVVTLSSMTITRCVKLYTKLKSMRNKYELYQADAYRDAENGKRNRLEQSQYLYRHVKSVLLTCFSLFCIYIITLSPNAFTICFFTTLIGRNMFEILQLHTIATTPKGAQTKKKSHGQRKQFRPAFTKI